jgi:hypothetical protein
MNFDLHAVPFSRCGSYLALSRVGDRSSGSTRLWIRSVHGHAGSKEILVLDALKDGEPVESTETASPALLKLEAGGGSVEICLPEPTVVRIRGRGLGLRLSKPEGTWDNGSPRPDGRWQLNAHSNGAQLGFTALAGRMKVDAPWQPGHCRWITIDLLPDDTSGAFECEIEEFFPVWKPRERRASFDECVANVDREFCEWLHRTLEVPAEYAEAREKAAYVNWSCVVGPRGRLRRPTMFMSKRNMTHVWSWDNQFNAMATFRADPDLAWDQMMCFFDHQDASGIVADMMDDALCQWGFTKPPIYGWVLGWMMDRSEFVDETRMREIYEPLCRLTEWWFRYRDFNGNGIPHYMHGNDCGWDNCTAFDDGTPVKAPDLSAYLVIQMETLSRIAQVLGNEEEATAWQARSERLLTDFVDHLWRDGQFRSVRWGDHVVDGSDTLLNYLPIVLGKRLPRQIRDRAVAGLREEGRFLTEHGFATESVRSPHYRPNGYWRGPIWAPSTMIVVDGLRQAGETELARDVAERFCRMAAKSDFAENYDALTGADLCDSAYTWTSSVFLILANEYVTA